MKESSGFLLVVFNVIVIVHCMNIQAFPTKNERFMDENHMKRKLHPFSRLSFAFVQIKYPRSICLDFLLLKKWSFLHIFFSLSHVLLIVMDL